MNEQYKEAVKEPGPNNNELFSKYDRVMHWFRGKGTVVGLKGVKSVIVHFDDEENDDKKSECWAKNLYKL